MVSRLPKASSAVLSAPRFLTSLVLLITLLGVFLVYSPAFSIMYGYILGPDRAEEADAFAFNPQVATIVIEDPRPARNGRREIGSGTSPAHGEGRPDKSPPIFSSAEEPKGEDDPLFQNVVERKEVTKPSFDLINGSGDEQDMTLGSSSITDAAPPHPLDSSRDVKHSDSGNCDLYHGEWVYDPAGPLYTNNSCPIITQMQNCQGNGRPDQEYENWRWKPYNCNLPRFNAQKFLELMKGKTLAFIGDSVARNQMESMLCILWQVEVPKNRGNRHMQRWYFRSTSTMIVRIWSSWLVHQTSEPIEFAPEGVAKLHLDVPDETFMQFLPQFDVVVLSSGHWFAKQSVYVLANKIVGGQLWWPDKNRQMQVNNIEAFGISVKTILSAIASHPNYTGLTIVRSFSPDHYEGGAWNTGGSCTGKIRPATEVLPNEFTDVMHAKQVKGFELAVKEASVQRCKLRLMDITNMFGYRNDGHPGPFRSQDPNKMTKPGPSGQPPPQDCLHWCMPGPVDTWNELVMEVIRRDLEST